MEENLIAVAFGIVHIMFKNIEIENYYTNNDHFFIVGVTLQVKHFK